MFVVEDAAARHGVGARPRSEHYGFEQRVLFGVLLDNGALKAIDGRDADVVENQLLRVASGQCVGDIAWTRLGLEMRRTYKR